MKKTILKFFFILISFIIILIVYLSTIGIKTEKLNSQISDRVKKFDKNLDIKLKDVSIILEPIKLRFNLKTIGTRLIHKDKVVEFESIKSKISIESLIKNRFSLEEVETSTKSLEIKNLISFIRSFKDNPQLFIAEKIIENGFIILNIKIEFNEEGKIKNNYIVNGFVKNAKIDLLKKYFIDNVDFMFDFKKDTLKAEEIKLSLNKKNLLVKKLNLNREKDNFLVSGIISNKEILLSQSDLNELFVDNKIFKEIKFTSNNTFSFLIGKKFNIQDLDVSSSVMVNHLIIDDFVSIKNFFPDIENFLIFKNNELKINYKKDFFKISGDGNIRINDKDEKFSFNILKRKKIFDFDSTMEFKESKFNINLLNFTKKDNSKLKVRTKGKKYIDGDLIFNFFDLEEENNFIKINNLIITNKNKIKDIKKVNLNYYDTQNFNNNFSIIKNKKNYELSGKSLNADKLIDEILKSEDKNEKKFFEKNIKLRIDLNEILIDKNSRIQNLKGNLNLNKNKVTDANLEAFFSDKKIINFTIKTKGNEKITTFFSEKAKPIVSRYKFIKGFEQGQIDFYSTKVKKKSSSILKIYDFKLKELPILTKVLTLASLQGIADLLSGEGIRFNELEMNFSNTNDLMKIQELYAIGPAISILMEGYVEKDKLISLRGTLVPATTLNKTIGSIPFLGDILVGKKTGEGVFGVSFKVKGPPNNLETSVNPIKTLTPRFITRTLEKIKKN